MHICIYTFCVLPTSALASIAKDCSVAFSSLIAPRSISNSTLNLVLLSQWSFLHTFYTVRILSNFYNGCRNNFGKWIQGNSNATIGCMSVHFLDILNQGIAFLHEGEIIYLTHSIFTHVFLSLSECLRTTPDRLTVLISLLLLSYKGRSNSYSKRYLKICLEGFPNRTHVKLAGDEQTYSSLMKRYISMAIHSAWGLAH